MVVSVEKDGSQLASVTTFNKASNGNEIEKNIRNYPYPITINDILRGLRKEKEFLGLEGAKVYFRRDDEMRFGNGVRI